MASLVFAACGRHPLGLRTVAAQAPDVDVATVRPGTLVRQLRVDATTAAVHSFTVRIPQIPGQSNQFTLIGIVPTGTRVQAGAVLAQFDATTEIQNALDAKAKFDDLSHQVDDTVAQNKANAESRASDLKQAQTDLATAQLELKKAPILSAIDAQTDQLNVDDAQQHVAILEREHVFNDAADAAALRVLELQRDQQRVEWQRAQDTVSRLTIRAPLAGMVGLIAVFRPTGQAPAQPGDQLYSGTALMRIFDPGDMLVTAQVNEADGATLLPGLKGIVHLDAYPDVALPAHLIAASPVAVSGFLTPVRMFLATFHVDGHDPRLLPDLSASVDLRVPSAPGQLLVPRAAVHFHDQEPFVTVQAAGGAWVERRIEIGTFNDTQVAVLDGLRNGDRIRQGGS